MTRAPWLLLAAAVGALALFANRYLAGARTIAANPPTPSETMPFA